MADIEFKCSHCEQVLECPGDMAGETVDCPSCENPITVPLPGGIIVEPPRTCPHCSSELSDHAVLCIQCGYHLKLGQRMETDLG
ncbi:MAG: zinc-ribbon domain-containing protein [Kiritimatiellae bacterium]|nr:zinc-ribbon domain-containing protein [Kiritimatiellia bacterium]